MKKITLLAALLIVLMINFTSAFINLNIYIDDSGEALFLGETDEFPNLPEGVNLESGEIIGTTQTLTNKKGIIWNFNYELKRADINVILPENAVIQNSNAKEISLEGKQFELFFMDNIEINYTIESAGERNLIPLAVAIIVILIGIYLSIRNKIKNKPKLIKVINKKPSITKEKKLEIVKQTLSEREKKIVDKLKEVKRIKHSRLQRLLEMPKASFSRHIQELERKGIIKREGEGKNKEISLK
ncbi:MAG: helix-turn-helix transcriptional regulator [Candidatus Nanoarchaeia archaeon]